MKSTLVAKMVGSGLSESTNRKLLEDPVREKILGKSFQLQKRNVYVNHVDTKLKIPLYNVYEWVLLNVTTTDRFRMKRQMKRADHVYQITTIAIHMPNIGRLCRVQAMCGISG